MTEIWNLSTLCRCCHADGHFKSLNLSYQGENVAEIYEEMLRDTLGIIISTPPLEASYTICDDCIFKLRDAADFKNRVLQCEEKFQFYCNNEQFSVPNDIKSEGESDLDQDVTDDIIDTHEINEILAPDVKKEYNIEFNTNDPVQEDNKETEPKTEETEEDIKEKCSQIPEESMKNNKKNSKGQKITKNKKETEGEECKKQINHDESLMTKVDTDTGTKYSCKNCSGLYETKKEIDQHIFKSHPSLYKCEYCQKQLKTLDTYKKHLELHKNNQCTFCPETFALKQTLAKHLKIHTKEKLEKPYQCDICQKEFKTRPILVRHLKVHAGTNKKILCHLCGGTFNDQSNLNAHTRSVHEKLRPFQCKICKKFFSSLRHLKDHLRLHSDDKNQKVYSCDVCDYKLTYEKSMKIHRLRHDGKYMCYYCSEMFDNEPSKLLHIKLVHKKCVFCSICGKGLADKHSLKRHIDVHNGVKLSCNICGLKCSQKSTLDRHVKRIHNSKTDVNVVKTKCEICKRSFNNISVHMDRHFNRSCACEICGKTYPTNSTLNRHKAWKHFGTSFECDICGKKYYQKGKLNTHKLKVHKIKIEKGGEEGS